jgi:hypothetical protein
MSLEPDPRAVARLAEGADPTLLSAAARATAPSDAEVTALLRVLHAQPVARRRAWPAWLGAGVFLGGMAFAAVRALDAPPADEATLPSAPGGAPRRDGAAPALPDAAPALPGGAAPGAAAPGAASPSDPVVPSGAAPAVSGAAPPPSAAPLAPSAAPPVATSAPSAAAPAASTDLPAAGAPPTAAPAPDATPARPDTTEARAFAALLTRFEAGEAPARLLADVDAFRAAAASTALRTEAELLSLELRARGGREPLRLAEDARAWVAAHPEHPRVASAWLVAGDAAARGRDCAQARSAWAAAAEDPTVRERARGRSCR